MVDCDATNACTKRNEPRCELPGLCVGSSRCQSSSQASQHIAQHRFTEDSLAKRRLWQLLGARNVARRKAGSTLRSSRAVPHPSTNRALRRLTSEVGRDPVHSTRYGRQRMQCSTFCIMFWEAHLTQHRFPRTSML